MEQSKDDKHEHNGTSFEILGEDGEMQNKKTEEEANDENPVEKKDIKYVRNKIGAFVNAQKTQLFIIALIVANSVLMGVQTTTIVTEQPEVDEAFETADQVFLIIFTIEIVLQFLYQGFHIFLDGWLVFDFIVVLFSWVSQLVDGADLQVLRAFRIFRALRLITRVKVMRDIVDSLISTLPRMSAIFFLLSICFYIFGVMFTNLYSEVDPKYTDRDSDQYLESALYFSRLDKSLFTLFQLLTLDNWTDVTREFMIMDPYAWMPFLLYVTVAGFVFFNLIIAVLCDAIAEQTANEEKAERKREAEQLQSQIDDLKLAQEKTLHTIEYLIRQIGLTPDVKKVAESKQPAVPDNAGDHQSL